MVNGTATGSCSYSAAGETLDLSAYLTGALYDCKVGVSSVSPYVTATHDRGTAAAGKVIMFTGSGNGTTAQGLTELAATTNVATCTFSFTAIGKAV